MSWWEWIHLEVACEFIPLSRINSIRTLKGAARYAGVDSMLFDMGTRDVVIGGYCIDCKCEVGVSIAGRVHDRCSDCEREHTLGYQTRYRAVPEHKSTHAQQALSWYHRTKRPKTRVCSCGAEYQIPIKRGHVPRLCPECRERSAA